MTRENIPNRPLFEKKGSPEPMPAKPLSAEEHLKLLRGINDGELQTRVQLFENIRSMHEVSAHGQDSGALQDAFDALNARLKEIGKKPIEKIADVL